MRPAMHYTMGGVRTGHTGESPTLRGLFAAGEAACWDMHGFNRLGVFVRIGQQQFVPHAQLLEQLPPSWALRGEIDELIHGDTGGSH